MFYLLFALQLIENITILPDHYIFKMEGYQVSDFFKAYEQISIKCGKNYRDAFQKAIENTTNIDFDVLNNLAESKYGPALFLLGEFNLYGIPPLQLNHTAAAYYYKESSKSNFIPAYSQLAFMYLYGLGVKRNIPKASVYNNIACSKGSVYSCLWEIQSLAHGQYKPKSMYTALNRISLISLFVSQLEDSSRSTGHDPELLTRLLQLKEHKEQDDQAILQFLKYKAQLGDEESGVELATVYYYGKYGVDVDIHRARQMFEQYPTNTYANIHLGRIHHLGQDGPVDMEAALHYYNLAAREDDPNAFNNLGVILQGEGRADESNELFRKAANAGHEGAIFNLAMKDIHSTSNENKTYGIGNLTHLAMKGMRVAVHNYAYFSKIGVAEFNEQTSFTFFHANCETAPWMDNSKIAEKYYKDGNYEAALMIWMRLSDQGHCTSSFNAGLTLLYWDRLTNGKKFFDEDIQYDLAAKMFKNAQNSCYFDVSPYLYEIYLKRNDTQKAINVLFEKGNNEQAQFLKIVAMLDDKAPLSLVNMMKYIKKGFEENSNFFMPLLAITPKIIYKFGQSLYQSMKTTTFEFNTNQLSFTVGMTQNEKGISEDTIEEIIKLLESYKLQLTIAWFLILFFLLVDNRIEIIFNEPPNKPENLYLD
ncbi:hypothetical protein TRFO_15280 [Tritrichomonas foetus]|uniref:Sel1 repeat family protein n=1 Tax=Tritrichomonas foetus TaxID=1144522 RepID=A0A1J4KTA7_9EUKA|nr:hypothetical protein TRFO_15280 [Tritrichomonas foetus]|eukprot:OHT14362.1 hypothetical protein TRFO_15280 [Tritrichomonas foetus]